MAHIDNEAENTAIFNELSSPAAGITLNQTIANDGGGGAYVWIGGNDLTQEGGWRWDGDNLGGSIPFWNGNFNGTNVVGSYQNWGADDAGSQAEPDNFNNNQDALGFALTQWPRSTTWFLGSAGQWNDLDETNTLYYLIEFDGTSCIETTSSITTSSFDLYTSPSGKLWTSSGVYNDTIPNAAGCDSVITINLTITSINTDVTKLKDTLTAESSQGAYQWLDCEDNYAMITGANEQSYVPDEDGEYAVEITQSGCVDTSDCLLLILSSIADIQERSVKLYPNPTIDNIRLEIEEGVDVEGILVVDMQGKEHTVEIKKESGTRYRVNLHELSAGIYSIVVQTPAGQIIEQVQKL